jgi:hypothetical protein
MREKWRIPRRAVLRGLGTSIALPALNVMFPLKGWSQTNRKIVRTMVFFHPIGSIRSLTATTMDPGIAGSLDKNFFTISGQLSFPYGTKTFGTNGHYLATSCIHSGNVKVDTRPGAPYTKNSRRPMGRLIGKTFDQRIVDAIYKDSAISRPYVGVSMHPNYSGLINPEEPLALKFFNQLSWVGPDEPTPNFQSAKELRDHLFGNDTAEVGARNAIVNQKRKALLDFVLDDYKAMKTKLKNSCKEDCRTFDKHLEEIDQIDKDISALPPGGGGQRCEPVALPSDLPQNYNELVYSRTYEKRLAITFDILMKAFECDSTRIVTFMFASAGYQAVTWVTGSAFASGIHGDSHGGAGNTIRMKAWWFKKLSAFVGRLNEAKDPDGKSMLHNSLICVHADHAHFGGHTHYNLTAAMAGNAAGQVDTRKPLPPQTDIQDIFVEMMRVHGLKDQTIGFANKGLPFMRTG